MLQECLMIDYQKCILLITSGRGALSMWPKETLQRQTKSLAIPTDHESRIQAAQDRATWRYLIRNGAAFYEARRGSV